MTHLILFLCAVMLFFVAALGCVVLIAVLVLAILWAAGAIINDEQARRESE
mgnify:CR=1 FL=1